MSDIVFIWLMGTIFVGVVGIMIVVFNTAAYNGTDSSWEAERRYITRGAAAFLVCWAWPLFIPTIGLYYLYKYVCRVYIIIKIGGPQ